MKRILRLLAVLLSGVCLVACSVESQQPSGSLKENEKTQTKEGIEDEQGDIVQENRTVQEQSREDPLVFNSPRDIEKFLLGDWTYFHPDSFSDAAWFSVAEDGSYSLDIIDPENGEEFHSVGNLQILDHTRDESGFGNTISFQIIDLEVPESKKERYEFFDQDGDFALTYKTLGDGEIIIQLFQVNNGDSLMYDVFDTPSHVFRKRSDLTQTSQIEKDSKFYAICCKKDYGKKRVWLDRVEYDPDNKHIVYGNTYEALAYEMMSLDDRTPDPGAEYLYQLVYVTTDAQGKIVSYEEIEFDEHPSDGEEDV